MKHSEIISITKIASARGFQVVNRTFKNQRAACLIYDETLTEKKKGIHKVIWLDQSLALSTKRFLVALALSYHEFENKHVMRKRFYYKEILHDDDPEDAIFKNALHLLLPDDMIEKEMKQGKNIYSRIFSLANLYHVEPHLMYYKIDDFMHRLNEKK